MNKTFFSGDNPVTLVRAIIAQYPERFTAQQRRSMLGEVKNFEESGNFRKSLSVLKAVSRVLGFSVGERPVIELNYGREEHSTIYYAGIPTWDFLDICSCGWGGCVVETERITGKYRSGCGTYG
jgi:hypothetical protein